VDIVGQRLAKRPSELDSALDTEWNGKLPIFFAPIVHGQISSRENLLQLHQPKYRDVVELKVLEAMVISAVFLFQCHG
jgi:hypothetical protein